MYGEYDEITGYNKQGWNREGINKKTGTKYNEFGFDVNGIHKDTGTKYNEEGFNTQGVHKDTKKFYDNQGYNIRGFNEYTGIHKITGTKYDLEGYNHSGYDKDGYNRQNWNKHRIHKITKTKYDPEGYDIDGINEDGWTKDGYKDGWTKDGYNRDGYDKDGYDRNGYNWKGYDREGYNKQGFNEDKIHKITGIEYDLEGYDYYGYDEYGYDRDGYNKEGYDKDGYNREGYDVNNIDKNGINKETGEKDKRIKFAEEFIASKKTIQQYAKDKQISEKELERKIEEIRKSPCIKDAIDIMLDKNSKKFLGMLQSRKEQLLTGKISVKDIRDIDTLLRLCDEKEKEQLNGILAKEMATHEITMMQYKTIFEIKDFKGNLAKTILERVNETNQFARKSKDKDIRMLSKKLYDEANRVKSYCEPYKATDGEAIGYFEKPTDKQPKMVTITDELRNMAMEYIKATDELICAKTMRTTLTKIVRGEIDAEKIALAKKNQEQSEKSQKNKEKTDNKKVKTAKKEKEPPKKVQQSNKETEDLENFSIEELKKLNGTLQQDIDSSKEKNEELQRKILINEIKRKMQEKANLDKQIAELESNLKSISDDKREQ